VKDQRISRIVQRSFPYQRKTLAWWSTKNHVDITCTEITLFSDFIAACTLCVSTDDGPERKIKLVRRTMDRIQLDRSKHIKAGLLEAQGHSSGPGEEIDSDGSPY